MSTSTSTHTGASASQTLRARRLLLFTTALSLVLWYIPGAHLVTYPLRLFVTFIHEGGHALMTILTGGSVQFIALDPSGSGVTQSRGGMPFFIYMAGYLGTALFGALCLLMGRKAGAGTRTMGLMTVATAAITLLFVRNGFGIVAGIALAGLLFLFSRMVKGQAADFLASFLAVQLSLNALFDLRSLLYLTTQTAYDNDAVFMAQAYGFAPWFWAILWAIGGCAILGVALKSYWKGMTR